VKSSESRQWWSPSDAFFLENAFIVWIGSQRESFPRFTSVVWDIGGITLSAQRVLIFVISLVALGLLFYVIARTKLGLGIRAVSQDNDTALLMGVRPNRIYAITFGISAALAGLAGVLLAPLFLPSIHQLGGTRSSSSFVVVMVGGLRSVRGTLLSAMGLAIIRSVSTIWVSSEMAMVILFGIMILVLALYPDGIGGTSNDRDRHAPVGIARTAERLTEDARSRNGAAFRDRRRLGAASACAGRRLHP